MELIDSINHRLGGDLKSAIKPGAKLRIAASCFSIYAFEALKEELEQIDSLEFIFTAPTFMLDEATDKVVKQRREFHIPKGERERNFYGTEFEIRLKACHACCARYGLDLKVGRCNAGLQSACPRPCNQPDHE